MLATSEKYKQAIKSSSRTVALRGTITLKNNDVIDIDDSDILQGSLSIREQCVGKDDFQLGNAIASELNTSLILSDKFEGVVIDGGTIELEFGIDVDAGEFEYIPLGIFNVIEEKRKQTLISILAFDNLIKFDIDNTIIKGDAYKLLSGAASRADVELNQSKSEINELPNGEVVFELPEDNDVKTYRDLVSWVAQITGCFARVTRTGKLELVPLYEAIPVDNIVADSRFSTTIGDFNYRVNRMTMVSGKVLYNNETSGDGSLLELDENPLLLNFRGFDRRKVLEELFEDVADVNYTPFDVDYIGDPSLQAGDYINLDGGVARNGVKGLLTHVTWRYRNKQTIKSAALNPLLRDKSSGRVDRDASNGTSILIEKNSSVASVSNAYHQLISMGIATFSSTNAQAGLKLVGQASTEALLEGYFEIGGNKLSTEIKQELKKGWNTIGAPFIIQQLEEGSHELNFFVRVASGTFNVAVNDAEFYIVAENLLGGVSSKTPRANVSERVTFISPLQVTDSVSTSTSNPVAIDIGEEVEFADKLDVIDLFKPATINRGSLTPEMLANDKPEPFYIYADTSDANHHAYLAMDKYIHTYWQSTSDNSRITIDLGTEEQADYYTLTLEDIELSWQLLGSNDEVSWDVLDENTYEFDEKEEVQFTIDEPDKYRYYRWQFENEEELKVYEIDLISEVLLLDE